MAANQNQQSLKPDLAAEEKRLEDALAKLNDLHLQLRALRSTPHSILKPLQEPSETPTDMFKSFKDAADKGRNDIDSFAKALGSEETRRAINMALASRRANPKGAVYPWRARDDPNWIKKVNEQSEVQEDVTTGNGG